MASIQHPIASTSVGLPTDGFTNISSISSRMAKAAGSMGNLSQGERNGLRHVLWSGIIAAREGADVAMDLTNAHAGIGMGQRAEIDFSLPLLQDAYLADEIVDFLNNEIGRSVASNMAPDAGMKDIAKEALKVQLNEGFYQVNKKDGIINISREQLSEKKYDKAIQNIDKLDSNGLRQDQEP